VRQTSAAPIIPSAKETGSIVADFGEGVGAPREEIETMSVRAVRERSMKAPAMYMHVLRGLGAAECPIGRHILCS
jgi:hypothetical protein